MMSHIKAGRTFSTVLGAGEGPIRWFRAGSFFFSVFAAYLVVWLLTIPIRSITVSSVLRVSVVTAYIPALLTMAALLSFRFFRNEWNSIGLASIIYAGTRQIVWWATAPHAVLDFLIIANDFLWAGCLAGGLSLSVRFVRSDFLAFPLGALAGKMTHFCLSAFTTSGGGWNFSLEFFVYSATSSVMMGLLFALCLKLPWSSPGINAPPTLAGAGGMEKVLKNRKTPDAENAWSGRIIRNAGRVSILFGLISAVSACGLCRHDLLLYGMIGAGAVLAFQGFWMIRGPAPRLLLWDGVLLFLVGIWSHFAALTCLKEAGVGPHVLSAVFFVLGLCQAAWALDNYDRYRRYVKAKRGERDRPGALFDLIRHTVSNHDIT